MIFSYLKLSVAFLLVKQSVHCTEDTTEGRSCDVGADANTVGNLSTLHIHQMDIRSRLCAGTGCQCMLAVIQYADLDAEFFLQTLLHRIDRSITDTFEGLLNSMVGVSNCNQCSEIAVCCLGVVDLTLAEVDRLFALCIVEAELLHDLLRCNLALLLCNRLDDVCKLLVHTLRQLEAEESIHNKGYAAFAGLAVNTDDRLILSSDITWIDRQI